MKNRCLLVMFDNGVRKLYDCKPLLELEDFAPLRQDWLFETVQTDPGGYGVSWNEDMDLSESELWENGLPIDLTATEGKEPQLTIKEEPA